MQVSLVLLVGLVAGVCDHLHSRRQTSHGAVVDLPFRMQRVREPAAALDVLHHAALSGGHDVEVDALVVRR